MKQVSCYSCKQKKGGTDIRSGEMLFLDLHMCSIASVMSNSLQAHGPPEDLQAPLSIGLSRQEYWSGLPTLQRKKKTKELLPLLSQPPHKPVSNQGLGVGKGQGLIHSKINKKKLAQDVEETKKLQETEGKRERQEG